MAVHLQGGEDDGPLLVVEPHHLVCLGVNGILEAIVLGIDDKPYIVVIGPLAESCEPFLIGLEFLFFLLGERLPLFRSLCKKFIGDDG